MHKRNEVVVDSEAANHPCPMMTIMGTGKLQMYEKKCNTFTTLLYPNSPAPPPRANLPITHCLATHLVKYLSFDALSAFCDTKLLIVEPIRYFGKK